MVLRFGPFELDTDQDELRKSGVLLRIPRQALRLLMLFVRRAGEVITREEIQQEIWGSETHVDFEQGINTAIRQIRYHLSDNAVASQYLKTIPRKGYVFIAPVEIVAVPPASADAIPIAAAAPPPVGGALEERRHRPRRLVLRAAVAIIALAAIAIAALWSQSRSRRTIAVAPFRAISTLPTGIDPNVFTQELRSTVGALPRRHLMLREDPSSAQVRIDGTIQRAGYAVRVIVSGIDTASRTQLWTATYERRQGEHYDMAMQTAHLVAHEVARRFLPPPRHEPLVRTQVPPRVLEVYRRARLERARSLPDPNGNRAAALFEQVLLEEPKFAEAVSGLADVWVYRAQSNDPSQRAHAVAKTRQYATRALALQPDNAEARTALGLIALQYDWDLAAAEQAFREAVADDPEYVDAHYNLSATLAARGEFDASLEAYEQARALDPIEYDVHPAEGLLYFRARRYEEAVAKYRERLRFRPSPRTHWGLLWALVKRGEWNDAAPIVRAMLELPPRERGLPATAQEFRDLFRRLEPMVVRGRQFDDYEVAAYYVECGNLDSAVAALHRAVANREPRFAYLLIDPRFDVLRRDPRYGHFASRIK